MAETESKSTVNTVTATKTSKTSSSWARKMRALPAAFDLDQLCKLVGLDSPHDIFDNYESGDLWSQVYHQRLKEGATEEEAEQAALDAEAEQLREVWAAYTAAAVSAAETLLADAADLDLVEYKSRKRGTLYRVTPRTSWGKSAAALMQVVNGYGLFVFDSFSEFLSTGPYTARQAVLAHLGWARQYPAVYGGDTAQALVDRAMRRHWG